MSATFQSWQGHPQDFQLQIEFNGVSTVHDESMMLALPKAPDPGLCCEEMGDVPTLVPGPIAQSTLVLGWGLGLAT